MPTRRERRQKIIRDQSELRSIWIQSRVRKHYASLRTIDADRKIIPITRQKCKPVRTERSIQTILPSNSIKSVERSAINPPSHSVMDRVNGVDMKIIFRKRGHFHEQTGYAKRETEHWSPPKLESLEKAVTMRGFKNTVPLKKDENKLKG